MDPLLAKALVDQLGTTEIEDWLSDQPGRFRRRLAEWLREWAAKVDRPIATQVGHPSPH